jgi:hypothetical protein
MSEVAALLEEVADSLVGVAFAVEEARKDLSCHRRGSSEQGVVRCTQDVVGHRRAWRRVVEVTCER